MKHEQRIDEYVQYFNNELNTIAKLKSGDIESDSGRVDPSIAMFKRMLIVGLLDALSRIVYGESKSSRQRFTGFIEKFGVWEEGSKFSTLHLKKALELDLVPEFEDLRLYVNEKWTSWKKGQIIRLDRDIKATDVLSRLPKGGDHKLAGIKVEHFMHYQLLYEVRNALVHEFRTLGYGMDIPTDKSPYYHSIDMIGRGEDNRTNWQLVYPLRFLIELAEHAITNMGDYFKRNDLNPDRHSRFGTYFFKDMNPENL